MKDVKKNADGSVDIYFGPKPPKGKESNWLPTDPKRRFFLLARFYGPKPALFDGSIYPKHSAPSRARLPQG